MTTPSAAIPALQRRTVRTLLCAQVFSALGNGSTIALGSILAVDLSGSEAWAGTATTALTLGAALASIPLARLATRRGRRVSLTTALAVGTLGTAVMVGAVVTRLFPLLLLGCLFVGSASAANLQARFAVTDLASPRRRGRDLSLVVWAITIGAVIGPNTVCPGAALSSWLGIPALAGPFLISAAGMVVGGSIVALRLRPDPLLTRRDLDGLPRPDATVGASRGVWREGWDIVTRHPSAAAAVVGVVAAHLVMVSIMSMTPLHLQHEAGGHADHGAVITLIGLTISLHIAGMYALSPVMGALTDRFGARRVLGLGLGLLLVAAAVAGGLAHDTRAVTVGLVVLGLAWSAATVAGSTLLGEALSPAERVPAQGLSDAVMSFAGAGGGLVAGFVMGAAGFRGVCALGGVAVLLAALAVLRLSRRAARAGRSQDTRGGASPNSPSR